MKKYILLGAVAFIYALLRAIICDITHDEALTLRIFIPQSFWDILTYDDVNPNNHLLNTISVKALFNIFGESVFVSRVPSLVAFVIYLLYGAKISHHFLKPFYGTLLFLGLIANPFLLDFFSLSRGYGLALGFLVGSIYYLLKYLKLQSVKFSVLALLFGSLSVLANFSMINYWIGLYFIILLSAFLFPKHKKEIWKLVGYQHLQLLALASLLYLPLSRLKESASLYYGGLNGFYEDTIHSLVAHSIGKPFENELYYLIVNILLIVLAVTFVASLVLKKPNKPLLLDSRLVIFILLITPVFSTITQHYLFDVRYLIDRTAIFFIPLVILLFFFSINSFVERKRKLFSQLLGSLVTLILLVNLALNLSLFKTITWEHDSRTTEALSYINEIGEKESRKINLCASWPFYSTISYYLDSDEYPSVNYLFDEWDVVEPGTEYFLYYGRPLMFVGYHDFLHPIHTYKKDTVLSYPNEHIYLFNNLELNENFNN